MEMVQIILPEMQMTRYVIQEVTAQVVFRVIIIQVFVHDNVFQLGRQLVRQIVDCHTVVMDMSILMVLIVIWKHLMIMKSVMMEIIFLVIIVLLRV